MSLRSLFAQNLRQLSATKRSHAHVARALDINRQQFNNYITGKNLPNETVVAKICKYFKIKEADLFREISMYEAPPLINQLKIRHAKFLDKLIKIEKNSKVHGLRDGLYYIYFRSGLEQGSIVCSLLAVRNEEGICVFRRITTSGMYGVSSRPNLRSLHSGIIVLRQTRIFLLGFDKFDDLTPTFLSGHYSVSSNILYAGQALVSVGSEFKSVPFAITMVPKSVGFRQALKAAVVYPASSPHIDQNITEFLEKSEVEAV